MVGADRMTGGRPAPACPLCAAPAPEPLAQVRERRYWRCGTCDLAFLDPGQLPALDEERADYDLHENDPADAGYRRHLAKLTEPLIAGLTPGLEGLDYGCGPGPTLSAMLRDRGFRMTDYDPIFRPDPAALARTYDLIACTEAAEHFHRPGREFARLARLLRPGGRLGLMTRLRLPEIDFPTWFYLREISHVAFYSPATLDWLADRHGWELLAVRPPDVALFARR